MPANAILLKLIVITSEGLQDRHSHSDSDSGSTDAVHFSQAADLE